MSRRRRKALCVSLAQMSGGDIGHCRKTDGRFGSPPARKRGESDRRSGTGLFYRRTAEPYVAGAGRWCCRILARRMSSFRDFDRPWFCGSVDCCRRGGSCNDRSQFAWRSQHRELGVLCCRERGRGRHRRRPDPPLLWLAIRPERTAKGIGTICRDRRWNERLRHCGYGRLCTVSRVGRVPAGYLASLVLI